VYVSKKRRSCTDGAHGKNSHSQKRSTNVRMTEQSTDPRRIYRAHRRCTWNSPMVVRSRSHAVMPCPPEWSAKCYNRPCTSQMRCICNKDFVRGTRQQTRQDCDRCWPTSDCLALLPSGPFPPNFSLQATSTRCCSTSSLSYIMPTSCLLRLIRNATDYNCGNKCNIISG
jgi:hypothetical protein